MFLCQCTFKHQKTLTNETILLIIQCAVTIMMWKPWLNSTTEEFGGLNVAVEKSDNNE